jgi:hypothetical protein
MHKPARGLPGALTGAGCPPGRAWAVGGAPRARGRVRALVCGRGRPVGPVDPVAHTSGKGSFLVRG